MRITKTKIALAGATAAVVALGGTAAYAYFTGTGGGTSSATVADPGPNTLSIIDTSPPSLSLGAAPTNIVYTIHNGASVNQFVSSVTVAVAKADGSAWSSQTDPSKPTCTAADFNVVGTQVFSPGLDLAPGDQGIGSTLSIQLADRSTNQDNCKGVTAPLYFTIS
jgi:hypothetical protein